MPDYVLSNKQARQFILMKQGLIGDYRFTAEQGVCNFVKQAACIQYDPIDVCGKNAELVLQSRVKGFTKEMLYNLLYEDRKLVDYFDKNLSIISIDDWKYFSRIRDAHKQNTRSCGEVEAVVGGIKAVVREKGPVSSKDIGLNETVDWYWSPTKLSRAALETMYFRGDLIVHHKNGTNKYYALSEDYIPPDILAAEDPNKTELEYMKWRVLRRISAVGLMWNKPSDAWIYMQGFKSAERNLVFDELLRENKIVGIEIENLEDRFYCLSSDREFIDVVLGNPKLKERTELIAPLDSMLWDRKLIKAIFNFDYKWEIYTPEAQRKYGYYVLPILSGERFAGRAEIINGKKTKQLLVKNVWLEDGVSMTKKLKANMDKCFERFAKFNNCMQVMRQDE
ncbi:MAG: winged helix-turn-helix domain-containing protein [Caulobacteraceae bacterium]